MPVLTPHTHTHTPGPWVWQQGPQGYDLHLDPANLDADRALIAAAPTLLTVLEAAAELLAAVPPPTYVEGQPTPRRPGEPVAELEHLRRAVAQARAKLATP